MLKQASRPERILLGPWVSIFFALCAVIIMAVQSRTADRWSAIPFSILLGVAAMIQVRPRGLFKGTAFPLLSVFMLLQAASAPCFEGTLLATYAFATVIVLFFCFMQPEFTRTYFLLFLLTGIAAVYSPAWLLWAPVTLALMVAIRAFSMRGLVAAMLGLLTPYILIPVFSIAASQSLEPLFALIKPYREPLFEFPVDLSEPYIFSSGLCVILSLLTFLTAYGYPAKARAKNMAIYVLSAGAMIFPLFTIGGDELWLPLINLCTAYHAAHFIAANKSAGWVLAITIWVAIIGFIVKQLCGF